MKSGYTASTESWIATLTIATRLLFDDVRQCAVEKLTARLDSIDAVEVIVLAYKYNVHEWLQSAFTRVVERDETLSDADATRLPFVDLMLITRCREAHRLQVIVELIEHCPKGTESSSSLSKALKLMSASSLVRKKLGEREILGA